MMIQSLLGHIMSRTSPFRFFDDVLVHQHFDMIFPRGLHAGISTQTIVHPYPSNFSFSRTLVQSVFCYHNSLGNVKILF